MSIAPELMPSWPVRTGSPSRAIGALSLALSADPLWRWCWPDAAEYLEGFPAFARAFAGKAFNQGCAYDIADGAGAALWLPPGAEPNAAELAEVIDDTVRPQVRGALCALLEQMDASRPPITHWRLPLMGVEPAQQGRGLGAQLMQPILQRCDEERVAAYLEATHPRNIAFYERLGFRRVGVMQAGDSPRIIGMVRDALD
jgi:GNAT superfamily N-acetyltransferase